jgi:tRNA(Ile)-lysidine synthase
MTTDSFVRDGATNEPISDAEAAALFGTLGAVPALVLAVSGGPDSTALLWLAARWRDGLKQPPKLVAVTIDHGLRKASTREALAVQRLAGTLNVEHRTLRWSGRKPKTGVQAAARNARYRLLAQAARKAGASHVLTAHTLDDQAETVLFRMARGSGVTGLAGMKRSDALPVPEGRGLHLVRPLLPVPKARLIATLAAAQVDYALDPSNTDPRFARPRLRALMPALSREGLSAAGFGRLALRAQRVEDALSRLVNEAQTALCPAPWRSQKPLVVDARAFHALPGEIGLRLLARMIDFAGNDGPAELGQLETLESELRAAAETTQGNTARPVRRTLAGAMVTLAGPKLTVERAPPRQKPGKPRMTKSPFTKAR